MKAALDKGQFGPWALVTGASSGIGKEFTRQIAASGINVVLVARRDALLAELGRAISQEFDVQYRALAMDFSQEGFMNALVPASVKRTFTAKMLGKALRNRPAAVSARGEA